MAKGHMRRRWPNGAFKECGILFYFFFKSPFSFIVCLPAWICVLFYIGIFVIVIRRSTGNEKSEIWQADNDFFHSTMYTRPHPTIISGEPFKKTCCTLSPHSFNHFFVSRRTNKLSNWVVHGKVEERCSRGSWLSFTLFLSTIKWEVSKVSGPHELSRWRLMQCRHWDMYFFYLYFTLDWWPPR